MGNAERGMKGKVEEVEPEKSSARNCTAEIAENAEVRSAGRAEAARGMLVIQVPMENALQARRPLR